MRPVKPDWMTSGWPLASYLFWTHLDTGILCKSCRANGLSGQAIIAPSRVKHSAYGRQTYARRVPALVPCRSI